MASTGENLPALMEDKKHKNIDGDGEEGPPVSSDKRAAHGR